MDHPSRVAQLFIADRFPGAVAAFLGGSAATTLRTPTSDLDVIVVLDGPPAPFRQTVRHGGWLVEVFAHTVESFDVFVDRETAERRSPLLHMCAHGQVLFDRDATGRRMQEQSRARLSAGPPMLTALQREDRRYVISDLLDDLAGCQDNDEMVFIAGRLLTAVGELILAEQGRWLGSGKWLLRRLREADPSTCLELLAGYRHLVTAADVVRFHRVAEAVLDRAGGRLMEGYWRDGAAALGKPPPR